jgi:hypothetical protein
LATISSPRSPFWAGARRAATMDARKQKHNQIGNLLRPRFVSAALTDIH